MVEISSLFVTRLYRAEVNDLGKKKIDFDELASSCLAIAEDDEAGQSWCEKNGYPGYTSYASLNDLPWRFPVFADLEKALNKHVEVFVKDLGFDLQGKKLKCGSFWINILPEGGMHASHIHPHSVISGTVYVAMPKGASALKLEDPRLPMMMAAPTRSIRALSRPTTGWSSLGAPGSPNRASLSTRGIFSICPAREATGLTPRRMIHRAASISTRAVTTAVLRRNHRT